MTRKLSFDYPDDRNRWVISYADFITILLALFIVLYAVSQVDIAKMKQFTTSLKKSLATTQPTHHTEKSSLLKKFAQTKATIYNQEVDLDYKEQIERLKERIKEAEARYAIDLSQFEEIKEGLKDDLAKDEAISLSQSERGLTITFVDKSLFDIGSAEIKESAKPKLNKVAESLKDIDNQVRIEGHTDDQPIQTAEYPSNWELSTARATSIVKYLITQYNIDPDRLAAAGYGEYKPISPNTTPEGRQNNRRVDIVILSSGSEIFEPHYN